MGPASFNKIMGSLPEMDKIWEGVYCGDHPRELWEASGAAGPLWRTLVSG
jgi:hypothetical protein